MKAKTLIMAFALLAVMTGCSKTETSTVVTPAGNKVTLKAYVNNPATKVGFDSEGKFYWSGGDRLGVLDGGETPVFHEFKLREGDKGKSSGIFTGTFTDETDFGAYAVYPYNENHSVSGTTLTYDFPASYTYTNMDGDYFTETQGEGNSFNAPMWGKIATGSVQMKHLGGVFCIKIADMPCTSGTLTLTSDQKISGTYTVDLSAAEEPQIAAAAAATDEEKTVSIEFSGATEKSPGVFYVPAPVGEHDLNIKMVNGASEEQFDTHIGKYEIARRGLQRIYIVTVNGYAFEMKLVEAGTFQMGSTDHGDEQPVHQVTLSQDYWIGEFEVTQGLWQAVMGSNPSNFKNGDDYPVEQVSWNDICESTGFLARLNSMTGITGMAFTLPTEAQWEFAARGGKSTHGYKYSGSDNANDVAWHSDNSDGQTHPVGQKQPNELGIYDMSGNVFEWCADWYGAAYGAGPDTDPTGPDTGSYHVLRGGSWNNNTSRSTVSFRGNKYPGNAGNYDYCGFRLALTENVSVTGVSLDKTTLSLAVGAYKTLTATVMPEDATNKNVSWASDNTAVVIVDNEGKVKALGEGTATITVTTEDGSFTATCTVTVTSPAGTLTFTVGEGENAVTFNMVPVEAGTFQMGDAGSTHQVTLTQDYHIGEFEVTQGLWKTVMGSNPSGFPNGDNYPVEKVMKNDICDPSVGFLKNLNEMLATQLNGKRFALPTEAQWEYAAAGGEAGYNADGTRKHTYSGSDNIDAVAWYNSNSGSKTHPVGQKQPNELGIYDMSGNVCEWCSDWYGDYPTDPVTDPTGPATGSRCIFRGGGWRYVADRCTVSNRDIFNDASYDDGGFRLALLP